MSDQENVLDTTKFIQRIIDERDEALERNRQLEAGIEHLRQRVQVLLMRLQVAEEERAGLECCYDLECKAHTACMAEKMKMETSLQEVLQFLPYDAPVLRSQHQEWRAECDALVGRVRILLGEPS